MVGIVTLLVLFATNTLHTTQTSCFTWETALTLDPFRVGNYDIDFVVISLPKRKSSHFEYVRRALQKSNIEPVLFEAIDGKTLKYEDYNLAPRYVEFFEHNRRERESGNTTTDYRGHFGCTVSHLTVIKSARNTLCVLEDDADVVNGFGVKLETVLDNLDTLDPEWEVLVLGFSSAYQHHFYHKANDVEPIQMRSLVKLHHFIGGWGYIIRSKIVADKILGFFDPINWHIDLTIAEQTRVGNLKTYGCIPSLAMHPGLLRASSWDFTQVGNVAQIKTDTNL